MTPKNMFAKMPFENELPETLRVQDGLNLDATDIPDISKDIIFPDELNRYLRDKIQSLTHENGMLRKNLSENELQLKESQSQVKVLNGHLQKYTSATSSHSLGQHSSSLHSSGLHSSGLHSSGLPSSGLQSSSLHSSSLHSSSSNYSTASDVASVKIVDLSKKLREKSSELESFKTRYSKLEQHIFELQKTIEKNKEEKTRDKEQRKEEGRKEGTNEIDTIPTKEKTQDNEEQLKKLQEKLSCTSLRLFEALNSNTQLKNELKMANKLVQQEIGEPLEKFQGNSCGGWRGRAQVICDLQQKNNDLKEKLKDLQETKSVVSQQPKVDKRIEALTKDCNSLKNEVQETKRKLEATKARCKVLDLEGTLAKTRLSAITDSSERDQLLINTLSGQLSNLQNNHNDSLKQKQHQIQKLEKEKSVLNLELERERLKAEHFQKEVKTCRQEMLSKNFVRPSSSLGSVNEKNLQYLEAERQRLLELISVSNERLERERVAHSNTQNQFRMEKQKATKLEAKLARLKLDQNIDKFSVYSATSLNSQKTQSKEYENLMEDRLELAEENIKALQTRLDIERNERKFDFSEFANILQNCTFQADQ